MYLEKCKQVCPVCEKLGKKSIVYVLGGSKTLAYSQPFYDENGEYHIHDTNVYRQRYRCSEGHTWEEVTTSSPCPNSNCNFGKGENDVPRQNIISDD